MTDVGPLRRSVEIEYWVIDEDGRLTEPGSLVEAAAGVEREFTCPLLEVKTSPCETTAELRDELFDRLHAVLQAARDADKRLVPLATPLGRGPDEDLPSERTRIQDRVVGDRFEYVRHCAGTHVHVEQIPGREIDQLNALIACDPALALVNSSPYFEGERLAAGARSELYRFMAYELLARQGTLWPYVDSRTEWAKRIDRRYEEFLTEAVVVGFDRERVADCFDPEDAVWTPVQLREEFSTVEWRSPDAALPSQVVRLADDVASLVDRLRDAPVRIGGDTGRVSDEEIVLPEFDTVQDFAQSAVRRGLSQPVQSYLGCMGFDVDAYDPLTTDIDGPEELSPTEVRQCRLGYADRLERDLQRTPSVADD